MVKLSKMTFLSHTTPTWMAIHPIVLALGVWLVNIAVRPETSPNSDKEMGEQK
jgi:hypothetical protein